MVFSFSTSKLDVEKIRWMMHRKDDRFWLDDEMEIHEKLSEGIEETMVFLNSCSKEELDILGDVFIDLMEENSNERGEGIFIDFLKELGKRKSDDLLESVASFQKFKLEELGEQYDE